MLRTILVYGSIAGLIVGVPMIAQVVALQGSMPHGAIGMVIGYTTMLVALSVIFLAVKRRRDVDGGGVIRFWPAFGLGLGIGLVAGVFYVAAWEIAQAVTGMDFGGDWARGMVASARAKGVSGAALAKVQGEAEAFRASYANPLMRWPMTFMEIAPVALLVSLVTAAVLRNPRVLPARAASA